LSKRIITLGTWNDKPIEWIVLNEECFGTLVISKYEIAHMKFHDNSSDNNWGSCSLRKYLNKDFFNSAFNDAEKKKVVNSHLNTTKDNVFLLTETEVKDLILKNGNDPYEDSHFKDCSYCCWTRSKNCSKIRNGYAKGCWCSSSPYNNTYAVRPAMYIKEK